MGSSSESGPTTIFQKARARLRCAFVMRATLQHSSIAADSFDKQAVNGYRRAP